LAHLRVGYVPRVRGGSVNTQAVGWGPTYALVCDHASPGRYGLHNDPSTTLFPLPRSIVPLNQVEWLTPPLLKWHRMHSPTPSLGPQALRGSSLGLAQVGQEPLDDPTTINWGPIPENERPPGTSRRRCPGKTPTSAEFIACPRRWKYNVPPGDRTLLA
jgi:hypothetical protein